MLYGEVDAQTLKNPSWKAQSWSLACLFLRS